MTDSISARAAYTGKGRALFFLAFRTGLLTVLTLGIYRFWAKTRIRRFIWASARLDGARMEYTGTGLEKFLGFLLAVVFLAIYLGLVQILLFWFGMTLFAPAQTPEQALLQSLGASLSGLAVVPLVFFAIYRARRYKMARTRWRGIRFGMDKAAWGYAWRAMGYWALTLASFGLLTPLMTFRLEKYMTDHSWFGTARFRQNGRWTELYGKMVHLFIGLVLIVGGGIVVAMSFEAGRESPALGGMLLLPVGGIWFVIGVISYRVQSFAWLTRHKTLGDEVAFESEPRTRSVILTYIVGSIVIALGLSLATAIVASIVAGVMYGTGADLSGGQLGRGSPGLGPVLLTLVGYVATLVAIQAGLLAAITQPILRHYVTTLTVLNLPALETVRQREADRGADAEGFADALDLGGAV